MPADWGGGGGAHAPRAPPPRSYATVSTIYLQEIVSRKILDITPRRSILRFSGFREIY